MERCLSSRSTAHPFAPAALKGTTGQRGAHTGIRARSGQFGRTWYSGYEARFGSVRQHPTGRPRDTGDDVTAPSGLPAVWRADADRMECYGPSATAAALRAAADQLEAAFRAGAQDSLTLAEAERESGYSRQHLARMVRHGALTNIGRPRSPRVRRGDLPRKPRRLALRRQETADRLACTDLTRMAGPAACQ